MDNFIDNVINTWGVDGEIWLNKLANIIENISKKWSLTDVVAFPNLNYGFVAQAKLDDNQVVLKITYDSIVNEYLALKHINGCGIISALNVDNDSNALLLEQAIPGDSLKDYSTAKIIDKIAIYADVVNKIASVPMQNTNQFIHVAKWCQAINDISSDSIETKLVQKALSLKDYLLTTAKNEYICHGDLHLTNIIRNNNSWIAIDPKGVIAEKEFEVAAFDLLTDEEISKQVNLAKRITARNHNLAMKFGFAPQRLLAWIFIRNIISSKWHIEDNGDPSKNLFIAQQIFPLLK